MLDMRFRQLCRRSKRYDSENETSYTKETGYERDSQLMDSEINECGVDEGLKV